MPVPLPVILIPGLNCSPRLFAAQVPDLWRFGPVTIADHTRADTIDAIASGILAAAPPRFALLGFSMGGYAAHAIMRLAPERVARLALVDTSARPDVPEQTARRKTQIDMAQTGRFAEITDMQFIAQVHPSRHGDAQLKELVRQMAADTGAEAYVRQQRAIMGRPDARSQLPAYRCPTLVLVGDTDQATPPAAAKECAGLIPGAELIVVPDCGHLSLIERPEAVTAALVDWMSRP